MAPVRDYIQWTIYQSSILLDFEYTALADEFRHFSRYLVCRKIENETDNDPAYQSTGKHR